MSSGIIYPVIDERTGGMAVKTVARTSTYGRTLFKGFAFDAGPEATTSYNIKFPFGVDLVEGLLLGNCADGDKVSFEIAPDTSLNAFSQAYGGPVNILQSGIGVSNTGFALNPTLLSSSTPFNFIDRALIDVGGYRITVSEGELEEGPFLVVGYDRSTGQISLGTIREWFTSEPAVWGGFVNNFSTSATLKMTRVILDEIEVSSAPNTLRFGTYGQDSAPLPANVTIRVRYTNTTNSLRRIRVQLQLLTGKIE